MTTYLEDITAKKLSERIGGLTTGQIKKLVVTAHRAELSGENVTPRTAMILRYAIGFLSVRLKHTELKLFMDKLYDLSSRQSKQDRISGKPLYI